MEGNNPTKEQVASVKQYNENNLLSWGGAKSETQQRMDWSSAGLSVQEPLVWEVESGINRVIALLKEKKLNSVHTPESLTLTDNLPRR